MKRSALSLWFAAVAILIAGNCYVCYSSVRRLIENAALVSRSRDTIFATERALSQLREAEAAERGYLITGEKAYHKAFEKTESLIRAELGKLRRLMSDDPEEVRLVDALEQNSERWRTMLHEAIEAREEGGLGAIVALVRRQQGDASREQVRELAQSLRDRESTELDRRSAERDQSAGTAIGTLIGAGVLNLLLLGVVAYAVRRDSQAQAREVEQRIRAQELEANYLRVAEQYEERRRFAEALELLNARLGQSNRELEGFAAVASHDLQEPLRKIQAFGDRLRKRFSEQLGPDGGDYLARMHKAASRMATLIDDLLTFSRVTTKARSFEPVDLSQVVSEVISDLEARLEASGGRVDVAHPLPVIDADPTQMRQMFQNLIANGLKFHRPGVPPLVRVSARTQPAAGAEGAVCEITVSDNGIGFKEKYLDRIFNVFQRLHGRSEYEGTGIGLAVVRKIIERHGGTVTARSQEGQGAAFVVTLPAAHREGAGMVVDDQEDGPAVVRGLQGVQR